ncbi:MAG: hypothetical protein LBD31_02465 [Treponema sp.]|jgi:hypothetical protein|nr:hypothetical protein [Treponema sp.]
MAGKNDPSIYDDRSTIGSPDELDEYGVWVKTEPQDLSSSGIEELPDIDAGFIDDLDLPDFSGGVPSSTETGETEIPALGGLADIDSLDDIGGLPDLDSIESLADMGDVENIGPEDSENSGPASTGQDGFSEVSLDDFIDLGEFDHPGPEEPAAPGVLSPPQGSPGAAELSNQLLMKIAEELSSIKKELSSLKKELSGVRGGGKPETDPKAGFFDEEEDEKIALTGDEMDNILNTASFTEETGSGEALAGEDLFTGKAGLPLEDVLLSGQDDLLNENSGGASFEELGLAGEEDPQPDSLEGEHFDVSMDLGKEGLPAFDEVSEELDILRETGAPPITTAPEDTAYLEADPLAPVQDEILDLTEAAIDEPDLSGEITENPLNEPALDNIAIDLDMEEPAAEPSGDSPEDFVFETEDTLEIPLDESLEDDIPLAEEAGEFSLDENQGAAEEIDFSVEESLPADGNLAVEESLDISSTPVAEIGSASAMGAQMAAEEIPSGLKQELKTVLSYMDQLLESLPEEKIEEFAKSEYFDTYKKLFEELGLA